jgi:hypothetical protein
MRSRSGRLATSQKPKIELVAEFHLATHNAPMLSRQRAALPKCDITMLHKMPRTVSTIPNPFVDWSTVSEPESPICRRFELWDHDEIIFAAQVNAGIQLKRIRFNVPQPQTLRDYH